MRNIRYILCMLIVLTIAVSSISAFGYVYLEEYKYMDSVFKYDVGEFAEVVEEELTAKNTLEDTNRFKLLTSFGIWEDVDVEAVSLVTKSEFEVMSMRAQFGNPNSFEEGILEQKNNEYVSYAEVLKNMITATGHDYKLNAYKSGDESLLIVAKEIGLTRGVTIPSLKGIVTYRDLAKLLVNMITIDLAEIEYIGSGYNYRELEGTSLLSSRLGIKELTGFVNAVPGLAIYGNDDVRDGYMEIDQREVYCNGILPVEYLGKRVVAYARLDEATRIYTLLYIAPDMESKSYELDFKDIAEITDTDLVYFEGDDDKKVDITKLEYITENGKKLSSIDEMSDFAKSEGKIIFASTKDDGKIDSAFIWKYQYLVIGFNSTIERKMGFAYNQEYKGSNSLNMYDSSIIQVTIDGEKSKWENIQPGQTVRITSNEDGTFYEMVAQTGLIKAGVITALEEDTVTINDQKFRISKDIKNHIEKSLNDPTMPVFDKFPELKIGLLGNFYHNNGLLVAAEDTSEYEIGYLRSVTPSRSSVNPEVTLRIFTQDSVWKNYNLAEKITFDGLKKVTREQALETFKLDPTSYLNKPVRFKTNDNEEIIFLDTAKDNFSLEGNDPNRINCVNDNFRWMTNWTYMFLGRDSDYHLSSNVVIFRVPANNKEQDFKVIGNTSLPFSMENQSLYTIRLDLYNPDEFNTINLGVYRLEEAGSSLQTMGITDKDIGYMHVNKIARIVVNEDLGTYGYRIYGLDFINGGTRGSGSCAPKIFTVTDEIYEAAGGFNKGDFIMYKISGANIVNFSVILPDGKVPGAGEPDVFEAAYGTTGTDRIVVSGTVQAVDTVRKYILIKSVLADGSERMTLTCPRAMALINTEADAAYNIKLTDFNKGDKVFTTDGQGHAWYVIKNMQ